MTERWRVLPVDHEDPVVSFEEIIGLIDASAPSTSVAYGRSDVVHALREHQPATVAVTAQGLVGAAIARVCGPDAHLVSLAIHPSWRKLGVGSSLLKALDEDIIHHGARRLLALVRPGQVGEGALVNQGFRRHQGLCLFERAVSMVPEDLAVVESYGGQVPPGGLWETMKGFSAVKQLLERRVVAPLSHPDLASEVGLSAPAAILLFGPPGTGKTSFARAVASRLSWVFVELHPSLLGEGSQGAAALRKAFDDLHAIEKLVCFIDEADEIAADRADRPESQAIVNELLKSLPAFRGRPNRLMVMATNSIATLDPALLRPGRFDLIVPVGAPDEAGRRELAAELVPAGDPQEVAHATSGFTPADFALVAQRSAQRAFDRALSGGEAAVTAADVLAAVQSTRPSVSAVASERFTTESETYSRL